MKTANLISAWLWQCECGHENIEKGFDCIKSGDLTVEDAHKMGILEKWQTEFPEEFQGDGAFFMMPDTVTCECCGEEYRNSTCAE